MASRGGYGCAESPVAEAAAEQAAPAPIASFADLDARMAEISGTPAPATPVGPPAQGEPARDQPTPPTPEKPAEAEQADVQDEGEELAETEGAPPKPGGRFARLREQLTTAETKAREYEQQLSQLSQREQHALAQFVNLVLPDSTFEALRVKAEGGDWEAKQQIDQARQWRQMVAPIADLAQRAARQQFDAALADLRTLDGMDGDSHRKLLDASTPGDKLKLAWQMAHKAASDASKERIAALEAEVATLKTNRTANGTQPASGGARAATANGAMVGLIGADGLPTEEAIQRANRGELRSLGVG
jgi:hypothetical protein